MAIKQSILLEQAMAHRQRTASQVKTAAIQENFSTTNRRKAFLCHSHEDKELAEGLVEILKKAGIDLYVDWKDNTMPDTPNEETALRIKNRICGSQVFLFLATEKAKKSRWCPWEIGYADSENKKIYIVPTQDESSNYGNEYLGLYPKIDEGLLNGAMAGYAVFYPSSTGKHGKLLSTLVNEGGVL